MSAALVVGILTAGGVYMILQRGIVRIALGFVLLGHATTTLLLAAGGTDQRGVPFTGAPGSADPLPQAFALTAIVIAFAMTAFLLALAYRGRDVIGHDDIEGDEHETDGIPAYERGAEDVDAEVIVDGGDRNTGPAS